MKRITSIVLALVMILSVMTVSITGVSAEITTSGGNGESVVTLTVNARNLRVTVPSVLPIDVDSDNNVTVATNAKINNLSDGPIEVTNVSVESQNDWEIVPFNTDFTKVPVDTKKYGMTMYNDDVSDGVPMALFDVIEGDSDLAVVYDGNVAIQSNAYNKLDIGHVVFTVRWKSETASDTRPKLSVGETPRIAMNKVNTTVQHKYFVKESSTIDAAIGTNFYIDFNDTPYENRDMSDDTIKVVFSWGNKAISHVGETEWTYSDTESRMSEVTNLSPVELDGKQYYTATCNVAAKELNDQITAELVADGNVIDCAQYKTSDYFYAIINDEKYANSSDAKDIALINCSKALLTYSSKAQLLFNYHTSTLADAELSEPFTWKTKEEAITELTAILETLHVNIDNNTIPGMLYAGDTLTLKDEIKLNNYFTKNPDRITINSLRAYGYKGNGSVVEFNTDSVVSSSQIKLSIVGVPLEFITKDIFVEVNGEITYITTVAACINGNLQIGSEKVQNAMLALYNYYDTAMIYINL